MAARWEETRSRAGRGRQWLQERGAEREGQEQRWLRGGTTTLLVGMTEWRRRPVVARRGGLGGTAVASEEEGTAVAELRWEACRREKEGAAVAAGQWLPTLALLSGTWVATLAARLACEKGGQWQPAQALLSGMLMATLEASLTCEKGGQRQPAQALLSEMWVATLEARLAC